MSADTHALDYLLADEPYPWADIDGRPGECADCPFAGESQAVNPADPGEGYYRCLLLGDEEVSKRQDHPLRRGWVWGEAPLCETKDWKAKAREELAKRHG